MHLIYPLRQSVFLYLPISLQTSTHTHTYIYIYIYTHSFGKPNNPPPPKSLLSWTVYFVYCNPSRVTVGGSVDDTWGTPGVSIFETGQPGTSEPLVPDQLFNEWKTTRELRVDIYKSGIDDGYIYIYMLILIYITLITWVDICWPYWEHAGKHTITNDNILNIECELHKYVNIIEYYI